MGREDFCFGVEGCGAICAFSRVDLARTEDSCSGVMDGGGGRDLKVNDRNGSEEFCLEV